MSYKDEWLMIEANDDIDEDFHREPTEEFLFYRAVANGDVETVRRNCEQARFEDQEGVGVLSRNPVTNMKYHFVVTTAMITRMCRQYGMELEQAFRLSDFYIRQLDDIHTESEVCRLHDEMVMDYTERMRKYRHSNANSKHINACREYIYSHIKERITIEDLSRQYLMNPTTLKAMFKSVYGTSLAAHVKEHRMERAAELLLETGDSMAQIARAVGYESQSKFTTAFKEFYQTLPTEYRRQHKRDAAGTRAGRNGHGR